MIRKNSNALYNDIVYSYLKCSDENIVYRPSYVSWKLTYACPNKCKHCYLQNSVTTNGELSTEEIKDAIGQLSLLGCIGVEFSGGDPLVRSDFPDILRECLMRHIAVENVCFSGSVIVSEEIIGLLKKFCNLTVQFTIFDSESTVHDNITQTAGSLVRLTENIKKLKNSGIKVILRTVILPDNRNSIRRISNWCSDNGYNHSDFDFDVIPPLDGEYTENLYLSEEELIKIMIKNAEYLSIKPYKRKNSREELFCSAGFAFCSIDPYGNVTPCGAYGNSVVLGNLKNNCVKDIWNSEVATEYRKKRLFQSVPLKCKSCELWDFCDVCNVKTQYDGIEYKYKNCLFANVRRQIYQTIGRG